MEVVFTQSYDRNEIISETESLAKGDYLKRFFLDGKLEKEEEYFEGRLSLESFFIEKNASHEEVLSSQLKDRPIAIVEVEYYKKYRLEKYFYYNIQGINVFFSNVLYDPNNLKVAAEEGENGIVYYDRTMKEYYDLSINPDSYLFSILYNKEGEISDIHYPNEHIDPDGQEAIGFGTTPAEIQRLIKISGISEPLMNYYVTPNVIPSF